MRSAMMRTTMKILTSPKMIHRLLLAIVLQWTAASGLAGNPIRLTLTLDPPEILPGIETSLRIEAFNSSSTPARMPAAMVLEVTPENGTPYLTVSGIGREGRFAVPFREKDGSGAMVPASGSRTFYLAAGPMAPWQNGRFWREPGVYRLRVIADDAFEKGHPSGDAFPLDAKFLVDPIASNYAQLTIVTPTGVDFEVFKMIAAAKDWGWPDSLANAIWQAYPDSTYAAYVVRVAPGDSLKQIQFYAEALAKNPRGTYGDWYRVSVARRYYGLSERALPDDLPRAFQYSEKARLLLEEVIQRNVEPAVVQEARQVLEQFGLSYDELKNYAERLRDATRPYCERLAVTRAHHTIDAVVNAPATSAEARKKLQEVLRHLDKFANEIEKTPPSMDSALAALKGAIMDLQDAVDAKLIDADTGTRWMAYVLGACAAAARKAIDAAAKDAGANAAKLAAARAKFEEARLVALDGDAKGASSRFKDALNLAYEASKARAEVC